MTRRFVTPAAIAFIGAALSAVPADAQGRWTDRGFVSVGATYQVTSADFSHVVRPLDFAERASIDTRYEVKSLPGFDVGGGVRVWRNLAVGASVDRVSKSGGGDVSAQVPHPFFFNRARTVSGNASGLQREETAVHIQAVWMIPMTRRVTLGLAGGPSWISLRQDLVKDVTVVQTYPYDTAAFDGVVPLQQTHARAGFNAGMTVDYRFARRVGAAFTARFSRARIPFDSPDGSTIAVGAGGGHVGAGIRFRF